METRIFFFSPSKYESMEFVWREISIPYHLYDFKLENSDACGDVRRKMGALVLDGNYLKLKSYFAEFHCHTATDELVYIFEPDTDIVKTKDLIEAKQYTHAVFKNYSEVWSILEKDNFFF